MYQLIMDGKLTKTFDRAGALMYLDFWAEVLIDMGSTIIKVGKYSYTVNGKKDFLKVIPPLFLVP